MKIQTKEMWIIILFFCDIMYTFTWCCCYHIRYDDSHDFYSCLVSKLVSRAYMSYFETQANKKTRPNLIFQNFAVKIIHNNNNNDMRKQVHKILFFFCYSLTFFTIRAGRITQEQHEIVKELNILRNFKLVQSVCLFEFGPWMEVVCWRCEIKEM